MELNLYDVVRIKKTDEKGFVVDISWDEDGDVSQYLVEKEKADPEGRHETAWFYPEEIKLSAYDKRYGGSSTAEPAQK